MTYKLHSLSVYTPITGSLLGTASVATTALTASSFVGYLNFPNGLDVTGSLDVSGSIIATDGITGSFSGSFFGVTSSMLLVEPPTDNTGAVGTAGKTWANGQFTNLTVDNALTVGSNIQLGPSDQLRMGGATSYVLLHDGTNNIIRSDESDLLFQDSTTTRIRLFRTTGDISASGAVTASGFFGTASWSDNAISASYALTASYAENGGGSPTPTFPYTGSAIISGSLEVTGSTTVLGAFSATTKSFLINHQRLAGKKLVYGVVEAPEHSVLVRGRITQTNQIHLPEEWEWLVDMNTITVQLTSIGTFQQLYVDTINGLTVTIRSAEQWNEDIDCYYLVQATRKDVAQLDTVV